MLFKVTNSCWWINYNRFSIFRRALDAEMKNATKEGLHIQCQKDGKEFVTAEEERKFWEMNLLGTSSAKSLLYTVYFYNGKIFGLMLRSTRELSRIVIFTL